MSRYETDLDVPVVFLFVAQWDIWNQHKHQTSERTSSMYSHLDVFSNSKNFIEGVK